MSKYKIKIMKKNYLLKLTLGVTLFGMSYNSIGQNLSEIQTNINANFGNITSLVPNSYTFNYDGTNNINDGGFDMYDGGNVLNTNIQTNIPYTSSSITASAGFGTNGQYFTEELTGLFFMAADVDNITDFYITGNNGADGSGTADEYLTSFSDSCLTYNVFIKRVYNAGDPSINHVMIIPENTSASHSWATSTDNDLHTLTGISATTRVYYMLFASASGGFVDNPTMDLIVAEFFNSVIKPSLIPVQATASSTLICDGSDLTLTATGGLNVSWDNGVSDGVAFTPSAGTILYTVSSNVDGCIYDQDSIEVVVGTLPTVTATSNANSYCENDMVTLIGTGTAASYTWDNGAIDNVPFNQNVGSITYTVTGSVGNGCSATDNITVTVNADPTISLTAYDEMFGNDGGINLTINTGVAPFTFDWDNDGTSDNDDNNDLTNVPGGTYNVVVIDGNGCTVSASEVVNTQLGIEDNNINFSVYPNPTNGEVIIDVPNENFDYVLTNMIGEVILSGKSITSKNIDLSQFENGIYFITIDIDGTNKTVKVVKN